LLISKHICTINFAKMNPRLLVNFNRFLLPHPSASLDLVSATASAMFNTDKR